MASAVVHFGVPASAEDLSVVVVQAQVLVPDKEKVGWQVTHSLINGPEQVKQ